MKHLITNTINTGIEAIVTVEIEAGTEGVYAIVN